MNLGVEKINEAVFTLYLSDSAFVSETSEAFIKLFFLKSHSDSPTLSLHFVPFLKPHPYNPLSN